MTPYPDVACGEAETATDVGDVERLDVAQVQEVPVTLFELVHGASDGLVPFFGDEGLKGIPRFRRCRRDPFRGEAPQRLRLAPGRQTSVLTDVHDSLK